jgi:hypothetical protein
VDDYRQQRAGSAEKKIRCCQEAEHGSHLLCYIFPLRAAR